jgi:hypothetical protein
MFGNIQAFVLDKANQNEFNPLINLLGSLKPPHEPTDRFRPLFVMVFKSW